MIATKTERIALGGVRMRLSPDVSAQPLRTVRDTLTREWRLLAICALLVVVSATTVIHPSGSMPMQSNHSGAMVMGPSTPTTGGVDGWLASAAPFMVMWIPMMTAMMLPALVPALLRFRRDARARNEHHLAIPTMTVGAGYFGVWAAIGVVVYAVRGMVNAPALDPSIVTPTPPVVIAVALLLAGAVQLSAWKMRHLSHCRDGDIRSRSNLASVRNSWTLGVHLGARCTLCCANIMVALLTIGMMNVAAMIAATLAISAERISATPARIARLTGFAMLGAGTYATLGLLFGMELGR